MNFIKFYIGDYLRDTGTLTLAQHGAYVLMLLEHYATEKPLPTGRELHRLLRADSKQERDAVDFIAAKFWTLSDGGLINARSTKEFARADDVSEKNRAIALAREAQKRARTEHEQSTKRAQNVPRKEHEQSTNQTPDTRHQEEQSVVAGRSAAPAPATDEPEPVRTAAGALCLRLREAGITRTNPGNIRLTALLAAGATTAEFLAYADKAKDADDPFAYLLGCVEGERKRTAAGVLHKGPLPNKQEAIEHKNRTVAERWARRQQEAAA